MKRFKIKASDSKDAYDVQQTLFKLGYAWNIGEPQTVQYPEALTFFVYDGGLIMHAGDDFSYFDRHENPEETLESLQTLITEKDSVQEFQEIPKHSHYHKDVSHLKTIDVYRVIELWEVTSPSLQHAIKKILIPGGRGAGKDMAKDIQEAIDSLVRWQEMQVENSLAKDQQEC